MNNNAPLFLFGGLIVGLLISISLSLGDILHTLQDTRAINSEARDALNCISWPTDPACQQ